MKIRLLTCLLLLLAFTVTSFPVGAQPACLSTEACTSTRVGVSSDVVEAYPEPAVESLFINTDLLYDRWYHRLNAETLVYDAPGGSVVRVIPAGFNFVTVLRKQDSWVQISDAEWVRAENLEDSSGVVSHFTGVLLGEDELPFPMAWSLINMYPSRTPGGDPSESNPLIWRYTRLNLYSSTEVEGETWYQVGVDQWVHQHHVAKVIPVERPVEVDTDTWISIDLFEQVVIAYEGNRAVFATLVSSGQSIWPTNEGLYNIYFRRMRKDMSGGVVGDDYYFLEEVPWTMFFDEGRALHGAYWHDGFGYRRSHGCVNLSIVDAHWLYNWVAETMGTRSSADKEVGPAVYVYSSGEYR